MKNTLETRLGIFFALALVVAVIILEIIGAADFFKSGYEVNALFRNAQELKKGDLVKMAGVEIGRVESIDLTNNQARVTMKIKGKYKIKTDAKAAVRFVGLMGNNFVAIDGGTPKAPPIEGGTPPPILETIEQPDISAIMSKLENVASGIQELTKSFSPEQLSSLLGPITDFMKQNTNNLSVTLSNLRLVSDQIAQGEGTIGMLIKDKALYNSALSTVSSLQLAGSQAQSMLNDAQPMIRKAGAIIDRVNAGEGTVGLLVKDPTLHNQLTASMTNVQQILEKINQGQGSVGKLINDESILKNAKLSLQKLDKATEGLEDQGPLSVLGILVNHLF